jgi:hypothetical protein
MLADANEGRVAVYTTLFTATDSELTERFPGWLMPLATPRVRTAQNPFTGEALNITTWLPDVAIAAVGGPSIRSTTGRPVLVPLVPVETEYERILEENCPVFLRTLPHIAMKGITEVELQGLSDILVSEVKPPARFVWCSNDEGPVVSLPSEAVPALAKLAEDEISGVSFRWSEELGGALSVDGAFYALTRLRVLARDAAERHANVFSHYDAT